MAYKDILVYLDPTAKSVERLRSAVNLANLHLGARLIGVDASSEEATSAATQDVFEEATRGGTFKAFFIPAEKPGEGDAFTHCVDLIVGPRRAGKRATSSGTASSTARSSNPARPC